MTPELSVVIPVYNECESMPRLLEQLQKAVKSISGIAEFIFVDDGSEDQTWKVLTELQVQDRRIRAIRLRRNFGQTAAMACGIDSARGKVIVTMDGDLQNDPADILRLLEVLAEGNDVVCGWRSQRQDKLWTRKVPSIVANRLIGFFTGVRLHDYGCSLKAYRAEVIKRTPLYAEFHRFIPALSVLTGASVVELKVNHRARQFGRTKYNLMRTWKVAFDIVTVSLLVKFAHKPMRFFGLLSLVSLTVGVVSLMRSWHWYAINADVTAQVLPGSAVLALWLAGHLLVVGLLAELCLTSVHERSELMVTARG